MDGPRQDQNLIDFYQLGIDTWHPISAKHSRAVSDLMDEVVKTLPKHETPSADREALRIAVLGRPNVGKSSLVNRILGYDRVIVSEIPGTTRDAIDTPLTFRGEKYLIIDTAGIRRKSRIGYQLEKYCVVEALRAAERSDVSLVLIDAQQGVSEQDVKIAGQVSERGKACVLVVNKWDLLIKDNSTVGKWVEELKDKMKFLDFAPIVFVSARSGQRVTKILETAAACFREAQKRIGTGELNRFLHETVSAHPPPRHRGREVKLYYLSQVDIKPPTFLFFTNYPQAIHFSYERYLANRLREAYGFEGTPVRLFFRGRRSGREHEGISP
jgi:GTP-binding protein